MIGLLEMKRDAFVLAMLLCLAQLGLNFLPSAANVLYPETFLWTAMA